MLCPSLLPPKCAVRYDRMSPKVPSQLSIKLFFGPNVFDVLLLFTVQGVLGYALVTVNKLVLHLVKVAVDLNHRRTGIASSLIKVRACPLFLFHIVACTMHAVHFAESLLYSVSGSSQICKKVFCNAACGPQK